MVAAELQYHAYLNCNDMGTGKTTMTLATCLRNSQWPTLVLVPGNLLVHMWKHEIKQCISGPVQIAAAGSCSSLKKQIQTGMRFVDYHFVILAHSCITKLRHPFTLKKVYNILQFHHQ